MPKEQDFEQAKKAILISEKHDLITQYPECLSGIGKFHITVENNVPPVIHPPWWVPISLKGDIKTKFDDMVKNSIIAKLEKGEPTPWVNSPFCRRKRSGQTLLIPQGSQRSHPERIPWYSYPRSVLKLIRATVRHFWCQVRVLERFSRPRVELPHHIQLPFLQIQPHALCAEDVTRHLSRQNWSNIWGVWRRGRNCRQHQCLEKN